LIILDLILPRKNGFDVLDDLRKDSRTKNIPVIVLSNLAQEIDIKEALARGAREYLVKTETRLEDVIKKIKKWLPK